MTTARNDDLRWQTGRTDAQRIRRMREPGWADVMRAGGTGARNMSGGCADYENAWDNENDENNGRDGEYARDGILKGTGIMGGVGKSGNRWETLQDVRNPLSLTCD